MPGIYAAVAPATPGYQRAGTAIVTVLPRTEHGPGGQQTVADLEKALIGQRTCSGSEGGASLIDFNHAVYGDFPLMLGLIAIATFLLLTGRSGRCCWLRRRLCSA